MCDNNFLDHNSDEMTKVEKAHEFPVRCIVCFCQLIIIFTIGCIISIQGCTRE